jgi:serine/threonine-protein kinase
MLFQDLINRHGLAHFTHKAALRKMCEKNPADRCSGFRDIDQEIGTRRFQDIAFNEWQLTDYRRFADAVVAHVTKIEAHAKYADDPDKLVEQIGAAWRSFMLEEFVPDNAPVLRCLISGQFYLKKQGMRVEVVKGFFDLMRQSAPDERRVILANLRTRLDAIPHYTETPPEMEADDIPF